MTRPLDIASAARVVSAPRARTVAVVKLGVAIAIVLVVGAVIVVTAFGVSAADTVYVILLVWIVIGAIVLAVNSAFGESRPGRLRRLKVRQPMIAADDVSTATALTCPNCGAPAGSVDASGVAVCFHCETRFLVR